MLIECPLCSHRHLKPDELIAQGIRAGVTAYVDTLCPWCRLVYNIGKALNSPLGTILCVVAIGAVVLKVKDSLS